MKRKKKKKLKHLKKKQKERKQPVGRRKPPPTSRTATLSRSGISREVLAILLFIREPSDVVVKKNPILLADSCSKELEKLIANARLNGKEKVAVLYQERLELLRLCRKIGIEKAFKQAGSVPRELVQILQKASSLSSGLSERQLAGRDLERLDAATALWRDALTKPDFAGLPRDLRLEAVVDAGGIFLIRFQNRGEISDLDTAIDVLGKGTEDAPKDSPMRTHLLSNLATSYRARHDATGSAEDLRKAVQACEELLCLISPDSPDYRDMLSNIGMLTSRLYEATGQFTDLDTSISHLRAAVERRGESPQDDHKALGNLGILLSRRYESTGSIGDLEESIVHLDNAVRFSSEMGKPAFLGSLASALCDRFERTCDMSDIDRSIQLHNKEIGNMPATSVDMPGKLNDLAVALKARFRMIKEERDLHEAIRRLETARELMPAASSNQFKVMINLQSALTSLYILKKNNFHLGRAIHIAEEALPLLANDSPWKATVLLGYSEALLLQGDGTNDPETIASARAAFRDACGLGAKHAPYYFLTVARRWATWELRNRNWARALQAGEKGAESILSLLERNILRSHKESWLREAQGLAAVIAYAYARLRQYDRAIEFIEAGQARLLTEAFGKDRRRLAWKIHEGVLANGAATAKLRETQKLPHNGP